MFPDPLVVLLPSVVACLYKQRPMSIPISKSWISPCFINGTQWYYMHPYMA